MKNMKNKMKILGTSLTLVGLAGSFLLTLTLKDEYNQKKRNKVTAQIRSFFEELGTIEVLFLNSYSLNKEMITGGVIMSNGKEYEFTFKNKAIAYREVK